MVGKKWLKLIKSLHQKKYRTHHQLFFVEGKKVVHELLASKMEAVLVLAYPEYIDDFQDTEKAVISAKELQTISALKNPNGVLAVFRIPEKNPVATDQWMVALDDVRDPGNLGTILRLCDWYGIEQVVCSNATVDAYNPKVLQATMGSISRVQVLYTNLDEFLASLDIPIFGAFMDGTSVYECEWPKAGVLVMGNEGKGISSEVAINIGKRVSIPQFGAKTAESLNVAMATGILLNELRRE